MKEVGGLIENLRRQVTIPLHAAGKRGLPVEVGKYIADFTYDRDGEYIIEDFKGAITDLASWKLRHVFAEYGVRVKLTTEKDL